MSIRKRLAAFAAAAALFITLLPASVSAHDGEHKIYKGSFTYYDKATDSDLREDFYYSDAYFTRPSTEMDEHLRTMSAALAFASDNKELSGNLYDTLKNTGFDPKTIQSDDLQVQSYDTIGTVIANKTTDDGKKLIAVVINGMRYGEEWASNLTVGSEGDAEGFSKSAAKVYDRLVKYEKDHELKGAKLWITGYSRGGAVADQLGKLINENLKDFSITENDLYDYTFAAPRSSASANGYKNIHDVIDPYDGVPRLLLKGWGMERTGTEYIIPCEKQTFQPKIINVGGGFKIEDKTKTVTDTETGEKKTVPADPIDADKFLDDFSKLLSDNISRETYDAEKDVIPKAITRLITDKSDYTIINFLGDSFKGFGVTSPLFQPVLTLLLYPQDSDEYKQTMEALPKTISDFLDASEYKDKISAEDLELTKQAIPALIRVFAPAIKEDLATSFESTATLIGNIGQIITNHISSSYIKELTALDSYYTEKKDVDPGTFRYFSTEVRGGDYKKMQQLGATQNDIDLVKNGYDVFYQLSYSVYEEKDVKADDKDAIAVILGRDPDLAIYFGSTPIRMQTFGEIEKTKLEEGTEVRLTILPDEDENVEDKGKFYLVSYKDGKAEFCDADFRFNDNGYLEMTYKYKDSLQAIVYLANKPTESMRLWGDDRYETARKTADQYKKENGLEKFKTIIIADGMTYADALSASYLAKTKRAPIILTNTSSKEADKALDYIHANCDKNTQIYIVGGESAVSFSFQKKLTSNAPLEQQYNVKRLAGDNRYQTNIAILKEAGVTDEELIIASGLDYADALSASAAGKPILLTAKKLTAEQEAYIKTLSTENALIVGGTGAVSETVETQLKTLVKNVERVGGKTRFETSKLIAEKYFEKPSSVALAYGLNFPDGLVSAPLAMLYKCPILLVTDKNYEAAADYAKRSGAAYTVTFGGTGVIADKTVESIIPPKDSPDKT